MSFSLVTWNINSVRLRLPIVLKMIDLWHPDVVCLQETKCPDDKFPSKAFLKRGYKHIALNGQKGYHGVATLSRQPFMDEAVKYDFCQMGDSRHIATAHTLPGLARPITLHNFYVPAGGDEPNPQTNPKFTHKLQFLQEMTQRFSKTHLAGQHIVVGDLNIAPSEHDVWSHKQLLKVVSHTPVEVSALSKLQKAGGFVDLVRQQFPEPEKLYSWWSYRAKDWAASDRGRRLDHIWSHPDVAVHLQSIDMLRDARGWEKPSDHIPVLAVFGKPVA